jgi:hypothetical protein
MGYDAAEFIEAVTAMQVVPHVAQNSSNRRSAVPDSIAKTDGYFTRNKSASSLNRVLAGPSLLARFAR